MDQIKPELTLEESLKQVMQTLPPVIRNYLAQGKYTAVAKDLMTKHALRIDQGGVLEREIMLLLMGIENPEDFTKALAEEAKLDQQTINSIVQEVNTQIFIPLRNEMMRKPAVVGGQTPVTPKTGAQTQTPPRFFHLENKLPPKSISPVVQPAAPTPAGVEAPTGSVGVVATPSTLAQAIGNALSAKPKVVQPRAPFSNIAPLPPKLVSPTKQAPLPPRPMESSKLLEDHEEPHIEFKKAVQPPVPEVRPSPRPFVASGEVEPAIPKIESQIPPNLPGAMPPVPVSPASTVPVTPKSYSADPYRELIEP